MRSSCDATATKFAFSWSSSSICSCRRARSIASATRSATRPSSSTSSRLNFRGIERADVQHADHVAANDQRHAEHRLDPLLAQDRVHDVGVVDVVEDHRAAPSRRRGRRSRGRAGCARPARPPPRCRAAARATSSVRSSFMQQDGARVGARGCRGSAVAARRAGRRARGARAPRRSPPARSRAGCARERSAS